MEAVLEILAANALMVGVYATAATIGERVVRLPPAAAHTIWLVLLLRLVAPPLLEMPGIRWTVALAEQATVASGGHPQPAKEKSESLSTGWRCRLPASESNQLAVPAPAEAEAVGLFGSAWATLAWLWLGGSIVWLAVAGARIRRFARCLSAATAAPAATLAACSALAGRLQLLSCPQVLLIEARIPPLVWFSGCRTRILLPAALWSQLSSAQREAVLAHELAHCRRRDPLVRWLESAVLAVHWWNPVAWWICRRLQIAEEECCDAWVLSIFPRRSKTYAQTLLKTVFFLSNQPAAVPLGITTFGEVPLLTRRFKMILERRSPHRLSRQWRAVLGVAGVTLLAFSPCHSSGGAEGGCVHLLAARKEYAFAQSKYEVGECSVEVLLEAQRSAAEAEFEYYRDSYATAEPQSAQIALAARRFAVAAAEREIALELWRDVRTRYESGRADASAREEAQTRQQYFLFKSAAMAALDEYHRLCRDAAQ